MSNEPELQTMSVQEFVDQGFLQELNRRFLHPAGIALSVQYDSDSGDLLGFGPIWDYRDDPEGLVNGNGYSKKKSIPFNQLITQKRVERKKKLGYVVQPCENP